jgi:hypothetical protein
MGPWLTVATTLAGLNVLLLASLCVVWLRNYRTFGSNLTLGLLAFAVVMLAENLLAVYYFFSMQMLYAGDASAQQAVLVLRALQFVALLFLTYVTMQ